jgi:hypothetical protein
MFSGSEVFERRDQNRSEKCLDVKMTRDAENLNRLRPRDRTDLGDVAGGAIDSDGGQTAKMRHGFFATYPNRPAKVWIGNQSEMRQIAGRKQIWVGLDERAQHRFRNDFCAH